MTARLRRSIAYSQNFLTSRRLVDRLLDLSTIGPDDLVLEIGPGRGIITRELAMRCRAVRAIEKDPLLAQRLTWEFRGSDTVCIEAGDVLTARFPSEPYKVFASIPFNCTAAILARLATPEFGERLETRCRGRAWERGRLARSGVGCPSGHAPRGFHPSAATLRRAEELREDVQEATHWEHHRLRPRELAPEDAYLIVQKEAAQRWTGLPAESLSSVLLKPWFEPSIVYRFRRSDFVPAPSVEAVMLRLRKRGPPLVAATDAAAYRDFVIHGFTAWQPSLAAAFAGIFPRSHFLQTAHAIGIDPNARPSQTSFEQWLVLFQRLRASGDRRAFSRLSEAQRHRRQASTALNAAARPPHRSARPPLR